MLPAKLRGIRRPRSAEAPTTGSNAAAGQRSRSTAAAVLLSVALAVGVGLRVGGLSVKQGITHDEALTYVAATGHHAEYFSILREKTPPYGTWVPASEWKRLIRTESPLNFSAIRTGLARHDIHPPLYFWLLHLWLLLPGTDWWVGPAFNVLIAVATLFSLYGLGRYALGSPVAGAFAALIWAISPNSVATVFEARQYELFALWSVLLVWQTLRCVETQQRPSRVQWLLLGIAAVCGLLTYYHFGLLIAACVLFVIIRLWRRDRRRMIRLCLVFAASGPLVYVAQPDILKQFRRARIQAVKADDLRTADRWQIALTRYTSYFVDLELFPLAYRRAAKYAVAGAIAVMILAPFAGVLVDDRRSGRRKMPWRPNRLTMLYFFIVTAAINIGLYIAGVSPPHAMEPKYPSMVWPFFAFVPVLAWQSLGRAGVGLAVLIFLSLGITDGQLVRTFAAISREAEDPRPLLAAASHIVVGEASRGHIPRYFIHFPDTVRTFITTDEELFQRAGEWFGRLGDGDLVCSRGPLTTFYRVLSQRYEMEPTQHRIRGMGPCVRIVGRRP